MKHDTLDDIISDILEGNAPSARQLRPASSTLPIRDWGRLTLLAAISKDSIGFIVKSAVTRYLEDSYDEKEVMSALRFEAQAAGKSIEEYLKDVFS